MKLIKGFPLELAFWVSALVLLAMTNPHEHHFSLCPLANMGFDWCPGCGLGRSISALLHGHIAESLSFHWLGIPALGMIAYRIVTLSKLTIKEQNILNLNYKED